MTRLVTFSFGGGIQSTAALVLAAQGKLRTEAGEPYETFLFARVGEDSEHPDTLAYVADISTPYAAEHGLVIHTLDRHRRDGTVETLYGRLMKEGSRSLPIPVRMSNSGAPGTRSCTADFKIKVVRKWQREHGSSKTEPAVAGIGISIDEMERARTDSGFADQVLDYPLLTLGVTRIDCHRIILEAGLPIPPKSACYFCPMHNTEAWVELRATRPDLFDKAVALEATLNERREMLGKDPVWMHRHLRPLDTCLHDDIAIPGLGYGEGACDSGHCFT